MSARRLARRLTRSPPRGSYRRVCVRAARVHAHVRPPPRAFARYNTPARTVRSHRTLAPTHAAPLHAPTVVPPLAPPVRAARARRPLAPPARVARARLTRAARSRRSLAPPARSLARAARLLALPACSAARSRRPLASSARAALSRRHAHARRTKETRDPSSDKNAGDRHHPLCMVLPTASRPERARQHAARTHTKPNF